MNTPFFNYYQHKLFSRDKIVTAEHLLNLLKCCSHLLASVGCHQAEADESVIRRNSRRHNRINEDALV